MDKFIIDITGTILETTYLHVINRLKELKKEDEVILLINSAGGMVPQGFAIYDILNILPNRIKTIAVGRCNSIANILFSLGMERYVTANTEYLMHSTSLRYHEGDSINLNDLREKTKDIERDNNKIINCILKSKGIKVTYGELKEKFDSGKDYIFTPKEIVDMGIATNVLEDISEIFKE